MSADEFIEWEIPEYLQNIYALWSLAGEALQALASAHIGVHLAEQGEDDVPPDTLMTVLLDREVEIPIAGEDEPDDDWPTADIHELLIAAQNGTNLLLRGITDHLEELDALPPWWEDMMNGREWPGHGSEA